MSEREKKLLTLLLIAGFVIVNFILFSALQEKKALAETEFEAAKARLQQAIIYSDSSSQLSEEILWLSENEPPPAEYQDIQNQLQKFAKGQALNLGLNVIGEDFLPTDESGAHYHRAQMTIKVSGTEQALYRWFNAINDPASFRAAYHINLKPNNDDTLIDCSATLAQWFPPAI
ncbi:MAG: hypothetical protein ACSHX7_06115 [Luteolibacter sp.]